MKIGAEVEVVVSHALKDITAGFGDVKENMDKAVKEYLWSFNKGRVVEGIRSKRETETKGTGA